MGNQCLTVNKFQDMILKFIGSNMSVISSSLANDPKSTILIYQKQLINQLINH
jgi:hypothetical protein